ncbi:CHAT domain-containing protein [Roseiconus lacunae]|uniref:CHAT domain-containing protein n=1 Tax=Roseiconus lacunae TaxID=2605694 RepID=UPI001E53BB52|nr:CHAT domain-containing protein [Roseiconus lacunae]MCD0458058.1 CHAT domain-containing protein [Roseiconus lacunae]
MYRLGLIACFLTFCIIDGGPPLCHAEKPAERECSFSDDFSINDKRANEVSGQTQWSPGEIKLGASSSILRKVLSAAKFQFEVEISPTEQSQQHVTHIQLLFSNNRQIVVVLHRRLTSEGWVRQPELIELRPQSGLPTFEVVSLRKLPVFKSLESSELWKIAYDFGVIKVSFGNQAIGTAFSGILGAHCHAAAVAQPKTPIILNTWSVSGTAVHSTQKDEEFWREFTKLSSQATRYRSQNLLSEWENAERKKLKLCEANKGSNHYGSALVLQNLATCMDLQSKPQQAIEHYRRAERVFAKSLGPQHPETLRTFLLASDIMARLDPKSADLLKVRQTLSEMLDIAGSVCEHSRQGVDLGINILFLNARQCREEKNYDTYGALARQLIELLKLRHGENADRDYYEQIEQFQFAEDISTADEIRRRKLIEIDQLSMKSELEIRSLSGDGYSTIEKLATKCLEHLGANHPRTLWAESNLAIVLGNRGMAGESTEILENLLKRSIEKFGNEDPRVILTMFRLGFAYSVLERKEEADRWFTKALKSSDDLGITKSKAYAYGLQLFGRHLKQDGENDRARQQLEHALEILESSTFSDPGLISTTRSALIDAYQAVGDDAQARRMIAQSESSVGESNLGGGAAYNIAFSKGIQLLRDKKFEQALRSLDEAEKAAIEIYGEFSRPYYAVKHSKFLTQTYLGNRVEAGKLLNDLSQSDHLRNQSIFGIYSQSEQFAHSASQRDEINRILLLLSHDLIECKDAYKNLIMAKGILTEYQRRHALIRRTPELSEVAAELRSVNQQLTSILMEGVPVGEQSVDDLLQLRKTLQKQISIKVPPISESPDARFASIVGGLKSDQVLVDFIEYSNPNDTLALSNDRMLCAFALSHDGSVRFADLGGSKRIKQALERWLDALDQEVSDYGGSSAALTRHEVKRLGRNLRKLVLDPIVSVSELPRRLIVSPDGPLAACPFSALPGTKAGSYLLESTSISYTIAPRLLGSPAIKQDAKSEAKSMLIVSDIDYGESKGNADHEPLFSPLASVPQSINSVAQKFRERHPSASILRLVGGDADEMTVGNSLSGKSHIHFDTHGFSLATRATPNRPGANASLGMSGIALSGANLVFARTNPTPGIMWVDELAMCDLTSAEIVFVAACETTPGVRVLNEGQLGIQRALAISGAGASITTLSSVFDRSTIDLIDHFYHYALTEKYNAAEALRLAKIAMLQGGRNTDRKLYPSERLPVQTWAPFVIYGQIKE